MGVLPGLVTGRVCTTDVARGVVLMPLCGPLRRPLREDTAKDGFLGMDGVCGTARARGTDIVLRVPYWP